MNIPNLIIYVVAVATITTLLIFYIILFFKKKLMFKKLVNMQIEIFALSSRLEELSDIEQTQNLEKTDGFLKFVSESREWAFSYIEDVQVAIEELRVAIDTDDEEANIEAAYEKVISFLPDNLED